MRPRLILFLVLIVLLFAAGVQVLWKAASHQAERPFAGNSTVMAAQQQPSSPSPGLTSISPQLAPASLSTPASRSQQPAEPPSLKAPALHTVADNPDLTQFARCLAKKQVSMYGAYWCPHCAEQKEKFGQAFKYVPYVECAVVGQPPSVQSQACKDMQIHRYPTWIFPDGDRVEAIQTLEQLSQKTGCKLP
jgi:thiol-disulfide isomerase/thioredoxin